MSITYSNNIFCRIKLNVYNKTNNSKLNNSKRSSNKDDFGWKMMRLQNKLN